MDPYSVLFRLIDLIPLLLLGALVLAIVVFALWCLIAAGLWVVAHRAHEDAPQPMAEPGWFEKLDADS